LRLSEFISNRKFLAIVPLIETISQSSERLPNTTKLSVVANVTASDGSILRIEQFELPLRHVDRRVLDY
jgi:hypothetical protein